MIVKEFLIEPKPFQEIEMPIGSHVVNAVVKSEGEAVLIVEVEDDDERPDYLEPEKETVGVYIVKTDDPGAEDIPEDFEYLTTVRMGSELGVLLFHIYVQDPEFYMAGAEPYFPDSEPGEQDFPG